jgi:hypothetical protein
MKAIKAGLGLMMCVMLVACATTSAPSKQEMIIGAWQAELDGQRMTLVYGEEQVTIREFGMSFPYEWLDADRIRLNAMGQEVVSSVEFDGADTMMQTSDGTTQRMVRVP